MVVTIIFRFSVAVISGSKSKSLSIFSAGFNTDFDHDFDFEGQTMATIKRNIILKTTLAYPCRLAVGH